MEKKATQKEVKVELTVSGMPEEGMKLILDFDHRVELSDRYYEEAKDYGIECIIICGFYRNINYRTAVRINKNLHIICISVL